MGTAANTYTALLRKIAGMAGRRNIPAAREGAVLLALVILMVGGGFLGAAMMHQSATAERTGTGGNRSQQAYYLAESGYRYAAAKIRHGADLDTLHEHGAYPVGTAGTFDIQVFPYIFDVETRDGAGTLTARVPFGDAPDLNLSAGLGNYFYLKTANQTESFQALSATGDAVRFVKDTGTWSTASAERVRLVVKSNGDALAEGGDLDLQATSPADAFPLRNGRILVDGKTYQYQKREANTLTSVTRADGQPWESPALVDGSEIVLMDFLELRSTGRIGSGPLSVSRELAYSIPVYGSDSQEFHDPFEDRSHWEETSAQGSHGIESIDGNSALKVTAATDSGPVSQSRIDLVPSATKVDLARSHGAAGGFLSYDAQVKIGFDPFIPSHYMAGITFRLNGLTGEHLGVSFQKPDAHDTVTGTIDGIPDALIPASMQNQYGIVLWRKLSAGWDWLAWKRLTPVDLFQDDLETDLSQWETVDTWGRSTWGHNSGFSMTDSVSGNYTNNLNTAVQSRTLDLSAMRDVRLSFYHAYSIEPPYFVSGGWTDYGAVEVSNDNGATWTELDRFSNQWISFIEVAQNSWKQETYSIPNGFLTDQMKIRFRLATDESVTRDGWYIDDVRIVSDWFPEQDATLLVRLVEAASITFSNGSLPGIEDGDILISQVDATRAVVVGDPMITSGSWAGGDAAGTIRLNSLSSAGFPSGAVEVAGKGTGIANAVGFRARDNYIQVYFGDAQGYGDPNDNPLDSERGAYPRIASASDFLQWPPKDPQDTEPSNDVFTLVQWDGRNPAAADLYGTGLETGSMVRTDALTTAAGYSPDPEFALHTFGRDVFSTHVYFDDFGIRTSLPTLQGFLPALQQ